MMTFSMMPSIALFPLKLAGHRSRPTPLAPSDPPTRMRAGEV